MKKPAMNLTKREQTVLNFLAEASEDFGCYPFNPISRATGIDRKIVRRACRSLKLKGMTEFHSGLCAEDGKFVGSGYCASDTGRTHALLKQE